MKILIKGAGDIATGIASRLYRAGHELLLTEIGVPLTVRRSVALSKAVYEGYTKVEDMEAYLAKDRTEAEKILRQGDIPVMVDEHAVCKDWFEPDVIVDAILAKRNLGTKITDAPFVIGVGPGFTAGGDCNCVAETKRGHTLGNIIWAGGAIPDTGVPGDVGGYTTERLIRAAADGRMEPKADIGEFVEKGQVVAVTGGEPVYAQMSGVVRGMLQPGVTVKKGLKIGDIDARAEKSHCHTISDKARAVGGGVLEAVAGFEKMRGRYAAVLLAAGRGVRFGENKLKVPVNGKPMYRHTIEKLKAFAGFPAFIVTGDEEIAGEAKACKMNVVWNKEPEKGISLSLVSGLRAVLECFPDIRGVLFCVCDQPEMRISTLQRIFNTGARHPGSIVCAGCEKEDGREGGNTRGNPVFWDRTYFKELLALTGDVGGKQLMSGYSERVRIVQAEERELKDIDRKEDIGG